MGVELRFQCQVSGVDAMEAVKVLRGMDEGGQCVRTFGEAYSQQCADLPEQPPVNYAEAYMDPIAMQNVHSWLAAQSSLPPPPSEHGGGSGGGLDSLIS
ncbi:hypothetical protein GPECTOR_13g633 [Gonium pectorale]|uniref:Uncharacterized protein n=1 Tax=Gonium pectorale TaxID=33097 RepID=A0A150GMQ1_GONPE|nr:hypothetical protein GPECTOR_13g633 [Gonium pectorale]|eukprot:KXZ51146.1 hypothetical protein GPECTOR_13g633 [Gonium pectorale]